MKRLECDFDYIVVGAGTAGCIVANRLSAKPANRVLILEAGGNDNWIWFHIPVGYLFAIGNPRSDWMFKTEPEAGLNGRPRIGAPRLSWAVLDAVGTAAEEMGIRKIPDFNAGDNEGVGYFHVNQKRGRRWSAARGFLKPALRRTNLRLETAVLADRLIVEQGRAVGVRFIQGGEIVEARARGEVILCAGSIGAVQVL